MKLRQGQEKMMFYLGSVSGKSVLILDLYILSIFSFAIESRYSAMVSLSVKKNWEIFFATILKEPSCIVG